MQSIRKVHTFFVVCLTALAAVLFVPSMANVASAQSVGNGQAWTAMVTAPVGGGDPFRPTTVKRIFAHPSGVSAGAAQVAYCLNYEYLHPKPEDNVSYSSERVSGDITSYIARQKDDAEEGIRNAIFNGYTGDARIDRAGVLKAFGLTEDQFYLATQYAVWHFSDRKELPDDYTNGRVRGAVNALIGKDTSVALQPAPAEMALHVLKTDQRRVEDGGAGGRFQNLVVANMIQGASSVSGSEGGESGFGTESGESRSTGWGMTRSAGDVENSVTETTTTTSSTAVSVTVNDADGGEEAKTEDVNLTEEPASEKADDNSSTERIEVEESAAKSEETADEQRESITTTVTTTASEAPSETVEQVETNDSGKTAKEESKQSGSIWPWIIGGLAVGGLVAGSSGTSSTATSSAATSSAATSSAATTSASAAATTSVQKGTAASGKSMLANTGASVLVLIVAALMLMLGGIGLLRLRK